MTEADPRSAATDYDVCLSFAGEQRAYVEQVATLLSGQGVRVFYDDFYTTELWGENLQELLDDVYRVRSRYCVVFTSADYVRRVWTTFERRSAQARAMNSARGYLLPVRCDDTDVPGLLETVGYMDARKLSPSELVALIVRKLAGRSAGRGPSMPQTAALITLRTTRGTESATVTGRASVLRDVVATALHDAAIMLPDSHIHADEHRLLMTVPNAIAGTATVLDTLVPAVVAEFEDYTGAVNSGDRLRIGVHSSPCGLGVPDPADEDVRHAVALSEATVVADVLAAADRARAVVAVSERVFDEVIRHGLGGVNRATYRKISGDVTAWVQVPGYPKPPIPADRTNQRPASVIPPNAPAMGSKYTFIGPVSAKSIGDTFQDGRPDDEPR